MADKNIQMKIKNGANTWDNLFPKTKANLIELGNGKTVEVAVTEILQALNGKATQTDIESRIKTLVGSAPQALDTLKELADALGNNANFSATITKLLSNKVDKVEGKQLTTEDFTTALKTKLESLKMNNDGTAQITQYVHPSTHPATIITADATHRFVSDTEKTTWNSKAKIYVGTTEDKSADIWFQEI